MKKTLLLAAVLVISAAAWAQGPGPMPGPGGPNHMMPMHPVRGFGGSWWKNSDIADKLKLTDQQKQQLEQTFLDYRLKLVDLRAEVERQQLKLQPLMDADQINEAQISSQLDALIAARGKLEKTNAMMNVAMRKVLTPEQWQQLRTMRQDRFRAARQRMDRNRRDRGARRGGVQTAPAPAPDEPPQPPPPSNDQM